MVSVAVAALPLSEAVMVTEVSAVTGPARAVKVALESPAAMVTKAGTVSGAPEIVTSAPPAGAACDSITVQEELAPDRIVGGEHSSADTNAGVGPPPEVMAVFMSLWICA